MRALWRELAELISSPDFLAIAILCLILGVGAGSWDGAPPVLSPREWPSWAERIFSGSPFQELVEDLRWELRLLR